MNQWICPLFILISCVYSNIIIAKHYSDQLVLGKPVDVSVTLYNLGKESITDVVINDMTTKNKTAFALVSGTSTLKIAEIFPNTNRTHKYTVKPLIKGWTRDKPAIINYKADGKYAKVSRSASQGTVLVYTLSDYNYLFAKNMKQWSLFFMFAGLAIVVPFLAYSRSLVAQNLDSLHVKKL